MRTHALREACRRGRWCWKAPTGYVNAPRESVSSLEPDPEIVKLAQEQLGLEPTTRSPRLINDDDPKKGVDAAKKMLEKTPAGSMTELR